MRHVLRQQNWQDDAERVVGVVVSCQHIDITSIIQPSTLLLRLLLRMLLLVNCRLW